MNIKRNTHSLSGSAKSLNSVVLGTIFCLIASCLSAHAQYSSGVDGTVLDTSGAAIVGATIILTNEELGVKKTVTSNNAGYFRIDSIAAGRYRLEISSPSFRAWVEKDLVLQVGEIRTIAPKLEPGGAESTVTVTATQASVDLTSASTTAVIPIQTVQQVPLVGQNVYSMAALAPGVTGPGLTSGDNYNIQYGIEINAAGQRQESNSFMIDGAFVDTPSLGGEASVSPNPEIVQSVQINTNEFDASKGRTSGANVQVYTNSGTNEFHGSGDFFFLNQALTSRTEFETAVPPYTREEEGATIGGPILKNKLFFYGGIDVLRSNAVSSGVATVETQDFYNYVQDNFNNIASGLLKIAPPYAYPTTGFQTVAQVEAITPGYFAPPAGIPANLNVWGTEDYSLSLPRNGYQYSVRGDYYISQSDRIYGMVNRTVTNSIIDYAGGPRTAEENSSSQYSTFANLGWTHVFSHHLVNEAGASLVRPDAIDRNPPADATNFYPFISIPVLQSFFMFDVLFHQNTLGWRDNLTYTIKSHTLKVGAYFEDIRENDENATDAEETDVFNSVLDFIQDEPTYEEGSGVNLNTGKQLPVGQYYRQPYYSAYVQDDWKTSRNLTINAGLRYDSEGGIVAQENPPFGVFTLGSGSTKEEQVANGSVGASQCGNDLICHDVWYISPRLGFSWDVFGNGRTAVRGGFGTFSDRMPYRNITFLTEGNPPVYVPALSVYSGQTPVFQTCIPEGSGGFNIICPTQIPPNFQLNPQGGIVGDRDDIGGYDPNSKMGQIENWTLSVQHQLFNTVVVEANYSGMASHHLPVFTDVNRFAGDLVVNKGNLERLNPSFGTITYQTTDGNAAGNYGSLMVTKQIAHGWLVRGVYTYGKVLDVFSTAGTLQGACACETSNIIDANNIKAQRGRADFDVRQQFSISGVWTLPNPWASGWKRDTIGGWRLGGDSILSTGLPFTVNTTQPFNPVYDESGNVVGNTGGDYNADGNDYDVPNAPSFGRHLSGQPRSKFLTGLFPASAFPAPPLGMEGNLGRNTYDQPGYANVNLNAEKLWYAPWFSGEKMSIEFRTEMVNAFNRPNMANVDGDLIDGTFGIATSQLATRQIQFHMRVQF
jgi:Carboxypeptidase regulatory-like domain